MSRCKTLEEMEREKVELIMEIPAENKGLELSTGDQYWIWEKIVLQVRMWVQEALSEPAGWDCAGRTTSILNEYMGGVISTGFTDVRGTAPFS